MSEVTQVQEEESNPYNMNKSWHTQDDKKVETADQLFFEKPKKATQNTAPEEEGEEEKTPKKRTNYKRDTMISNVIMMRSFLNLNRGSRSC